MLSRAGIRFLSVFTLLALLAGCAIHPPVQEMSDARQAIAAAREAGAEQFAQMTFERAEIALETAERQLRDGVYWAARKSAMAARESAFDALLESRARQADGEEG